MNVSLFARTRALVLAFLVPGLALAAFAPAALALPTISIANAEVVEGNSGTRQLVFNVTLSSASATDVWMDWHTQDGTAAGGVDYVGVASSRLTFPAGSTSKTISITVTGDTLAEGDEIFHISPTSFSGADFGGANWPDGKIKNDDALQAISIADATIAEDAGSVLLTVSLQQPAVSPVSFDIVTASGTATSGADFVPPFITSMAIPSGDTATSFRVNVTNDSTVEANETFTVSLANVNGATLGDGSALATIVNDDGASGPKLSIWDNTSSVTEGDTGTRTMNFEVTLSQAAANDVFFDAFTLNDSAVAGLDYVARSATAQKIPAGQTSAMFSVTINGDLEVEMQERLYVNLANVTGARLGAAQAYGNINDDDIGSTGSLKVSDVRITEGQSGTKTAAFTVTLTAASNSTVSFDIGTSNGTAIGGEDFAPLYLFNQTLSPGQTSKTFNVTILGDTAIEPDEYFYVTIPDSSGAGVLDQVGRGTILSDDSNGGSSDPMITVDSASVVEGNSGSRNMVFAVRLAAATTHQVSYRVVTGDESADSVGRSPTPWDYTATDLNLTIPAGSTTGTFSVPVKGDTAAEGPETFGVAISSIVGAYWDGEGHAYGEIIDDDQDVVLSIGGVFINEGDAGTKTLWVTVNLTSNATAPVTFSLASSNGTATAGSDFVALNVSNQTMAVGETSKIFAVTINGDTQVESDETFTFNLSNVSGAILGAGSATATIRNDDEAVQNPWLDIADVTVSEGNSGTKTATFTVSLSASAPGPVTFDIATSNVSATAGSDYVSSSLVGVSIAAGATSKTFAVTINGDTTTEPDETFTVNVSNVAGATLVDGQATGTISNDDGGGGTPTLSIGDVSITEGNAFSKQATFTVTLSAASASAVTYNIATANGTAVSGIDYVAKSLVGQSMPAGTTSKTFTVGIKGDTVAEPDETFAVNVSSVGGATLNDGQALGTITNDDGGGGTPTLSIGDVSIVEGNSGTKVATLTVSLSAAASTVVTYNIATADGTAVAGGDYVASSLVGESIAAGATSKTFAVTINGDTTTEPDETFIVNVSNVAGATVADGQATGTISNDDGGGGGTPTLSVGDVSITEGNAFSKQATFTVTLSAASASAVTYNIATANGTAVSGIDYVAKSLVGQSIPAGTTSKTFTVGIKGDTVAEPDETFAVNVTSVAGATLADGQAVGTITNDDGGSPSPSLTIGDVSIAEGNSGTKLATFTVSLSPTSSGAVTYTIATADGTAIAGSDYVASSLAGESIAAGGSSKTFSMTINGDTVVEPNETFTVNITNVVGATLADGQATGTISNDDSDGGGGGTPTLSIGDVSITEGNAFSKQATFTVSLSAASASAVTYNIATANGTAMAGTDYVAKTLSGQSIAAGVTSKNFTVGIKGDTVVEPNETFTVTVSGVVGATLADGQATGTITNDDAAIVSVARFDGRGLYDDIDDGQREPVLTSQEYASLLLDVATRLCARTNTATIVAVDGIENRGALLDLADAANANCASQPRYAAVMAEGDSRGFLVEATAPGDARGVQVLGRPTLEASAKLTSLQVRSSGEVASFTMLMPQALPTNKAARSSQLRRLGQWVQSALKADPRSRLVLIGDVTVPGLLDLTARSRPAKSALPAERVLVSPALLEEFGASTVAFPALPAVEERGQVLQLQR